MRAGSGSSSVVGRLRRRTPSGWGLRRVVAAGTCLAVALGIVATARHLAIPAPTGPHAVGLERLAWVDASREEVHTPTAGDHRAVAVRLWYPAEHGSGTLGAYLPELGAIGEGLQAAGAVGRVEAMGLRWVRHHARQDAAVATAGPAFPVVLLSPGNQTNVAFYATLAEELASRGYAVVGVDHPYQVAAVELPGGAIATYDHADDGLGAVPRKVDERVDDLQFVLAQLHARGRDLAEGRLDLSRVAVIGHSLGGLAAVELCRRRPDILACANLDGQAAGGPLSTRADATAPEQPFLFLTKERDLHPELQRRFELAGEGAYRVVVPAARHDHFADGALFRPSINPFARTVDRVAVTTRGLVAGFLDRHLAGAGARAFAGVPAATDVLVNAYPLGGRPPIP